MKLEQSRVVFNQEEHTYTLDGKQLSGVTSLLSRQIYRDKYIDISKEVLRRAAQRGSLIHETIELVDSIGVSSELEEVKAYEAIKSQYGLTTYCNEYLVSDNDYIASSIDIVFDDCSLADIKTTSKLDKEYVSWQLSIYAYLFELQNPTEQANRLYAIWLPKPQYGTPALVEVERKPAELVRQLIECDKSGKQFAMPAMADSAQITIPDNVIAEVRAIEYQYKELEDKRTKIQQQLLTLMRDNGIEKFAAEGLTLTYRKPATRKSVDSKMLQSKYPNIYNEVLRESSTKDSITIKIA